MATYRVETSHTVHRSRLPILVTEAALSRAAEYPLPQPSVTARALLLCARETLSPTEQNWLAQICGAVQDWDHFVEQAEFRLIVQLAYKHLSALPSGIVPDAALAVLKHRAFRAALRNLMMLAAHHRLARDVLQPLAVPHLFFKGVSLAYRYYREPILRQSRDIDVLVPRAWMVQVGQRLRMEGFVPHRGSAWATDDALAFMQRFIGMMDWRTPENILVEMPSSLDDWSRLPLDQIFAGAVDVDLGGVSVMMPNDADFFCYLCKHHGRHHWARLHWIVDLNAILAHPRFDAAAVRTRAVQRRFVRVVEAALSIHEAVGRFEPWTATIEDPFAHELFRHMLLNLEGNFEQELAFRERFPATSIDIPRSSRLHRHVVSRNLHRFCPNDLDFEDFPMAARLHGLYYLLRPFLYARRTIVKTAVWAGKRSGT